MLDEFSAIIEKLTPNSPRTREELESWRPMWYSLRKPDREAFERMIEQIIDYSPAIEAYPNPADAILLSIILVQGKAIERLYSKNVGLQDNAQDSGRNVQLSNTLL